LPLGIVGVVNNMAPVVTVILAYIFLHEKLGLADVIFLGLSLVGCITIVLGAKPPSDPDAAGAYPTIGNAPWMYSALFTCPIMSGAGTIALRKMRKMNTQSVALWCNVSTLVFNLGWIMIANLVSHNSPDGKSEPWSKIGMFNALSWSLSLISGILSLMNFVFKFMAMQNC